MNPELPDSADLQMRVPATPEHTSTGGDIFGGWIMAQVDIAGSVPAVRRSRGRVVTVAVKEFLFLKPVVVGDLVSIYARVSAVGNTSMTVGAEVYVERNPARSGDDQGCGRTIDLRGGRRPGAAQAGRPLESVFKSTARP